MFTVSSAEPKLRRTLLVLGGGAAGVIVMYVFLGVLQTDRVSPLPARAERHEFPDFTLPGVDGREWSLSAQRGHVVLINLFAEGCGPCRAELPELVKVAGRYRRQGLRTVGISCDEEPLRAIPAFINDFKIPFPVVACYPLEPERIVDDEKARSHCGILQAIKTVPASRLGFPVVGFPLTLLIDRAGRLSRVFYGYGGAFQDRVLDRDVRQLLNERS